MLTHVGQQLQAALRLRQGGFGKVLAEAPRPARRPKDLELVAEGKFRKAAARLIRPPLRGRHYAFVHVDAQPMARACCTEGVKRAADSRHISGEDTVV
jgi:hypothetical protein